MQFLKIPKQPDAVSSFGDREIMSASKTAFLCSRKYPAKAVLRIYDWAEEMRRNGECVVSGFHSRLERDVLEILLGGTQPVVIVSARGLPKRYGADIKKAVEGGRLLILSPFPGTVGRITAQTAQKRNEFMLSIADRVVVGYAKENGMLAEILRKISPEKEIVRLAD